MRQATGSTQTLSTQALCQQCDADASGFITICAGTIPSLGGRKYAPKRRKPTDAISKSVRLSRCAQC